MTSDTLSRSSTWKPQDEPGTITLGSLIPGVLLLPERGNPADFAEKHRVIPGDMAAQGGQYRLSLMPYQREPQEAAADPNVEEIILVFGSQCGKSTICENIVMYWCCADPGNVMWVLPDDKSKRKFVKKRLRPSIQASPRWRNELLQTRNNITHDMAEFRRMTIFMAIAGSESDLAQLPCKYGVLDEEEKMPASTEKEGSPHQQMKNRQRTFPTRKRLRSSTVTEESGAIWTAMKGAQLRESTVQCPHCHEWHPWIWQMVRYGERPRDISFRDHAAAVHAGEVPVWYECPRCKGRIEEHETRELEKRCEYRVCNKRLTEKLRFAARFDMLTGGDEEIRWEVKPFARIVAFHKPAFMTLFDPIRDLVVEWLMALADKSEGDERRMQNFWIHKGAQPYTPKRIQLEEGNVIARVVERPRGLIPDWCKFLGRGFDIQRGEIYWVTIAAGEGFRMHIVDHGHRLGGLDVLREEIERPMAQEGHGASYYPHMQLIDSGDGELTLPIYKVCNVYPEHLVRPCKGSSGNLNGRHWQRAAGGLGEDHAGRLVIVGSGEVRDFWAGRMNVPAEEEHSVTFHQDVMHDAEFQRQVTAEERREVRDERTGRLKTAWVQRRGYPHNHYFDAAIYATCALLVAGAGEMLVKPYQTTTKP